jgi:predicted Zn-dependent peptidase
MQRPVLRPETGPVRQELSNGSVLLTRQLPDVYPVAVGIMVKTGTRDEDPAQNGISHLLEHMVFKGTDSRTAFELARDMEALGGQLDAYTTKEHTAYTLKVLPAQLAEALEILSDMLERSTFSEEQLDLERQVVIEEILAAEDAPDDFAHERFCERLYPEHPLRWMILGTEESVRGIDRVTLRRFSERVHRGPNLIVAATGAVTAQIEEMLSNAFGFPAGEVTRSPDCGVLPAPGVHLLAREGLAQQYVEVGIPTMSVTHPDRYALSLLSNLLGGGMSSRLFQRVREEEGLAYSIYNYTDFFRDTGMLSTSFSSSPENCNRALAIVAEEYERLRRGELDDDELTANKAQLVSSVVLGMESTLSQMLRLARTEMAFGRFVPIREVVDEIEGIRREDIATRRTVPRPLSPDRLELRAAGVGGVVGGLSQPVNSPDSHIRRANSAIWPSPTTSDIRTQPRPQSPKALPGVSRTPVLSSSSRTKPRSSPAGQPVGIAVHRYIPARGDRTDQPISARPATSRSRRCRYICRLDATADFPSRRAAATARCTPWNMPKSAWLLTRANASRAIGLPTAKPHRHPAIAWLLLNDCNSTATDLAPSISRIDGGVRPSSSASSL